MSPVTFTITTDHITLLRAADWDSGEGTPGIDWKRPYLGTSSVRSALAELLIPGWKEMSDEQQEAAQDEHDDRLWDVHTDLSTVVAIGIDTLSFAPGTYHRNESGWYRHVGDPEPEPDPSDPRQIAVSLMLDAARSPDRTKVWDAIDEARPGITVYARQAERNSLLQAIYELAETADITIGWAEVAE